MSSAHLPIVDAFLAGDFPLVRQIALAAPVSDPFSKHYQALAAAIDFLEKGTCLSVDEMFREALKEPPSDPELFVVLLRFAIDVVLRVGKVSEAWRCLRLLKQVDDPFIRRELKLGADLVNESAIYFFVGDYEKAARPLDDALKLGVTPGTLSWFRIKTNRAMIATHNCNYTQVEQDLNDISAYPELNDRYMASTAWQKALLCRERGKFDEGLALLDSAGPVLSRRTAFLILRIQLLLLGGKLVQARTLLADEERSGNKLLTLREYHDLRALEALVEADPVRMRQHARIAIAKAGRTSPAQLRASMALLVHAELLSRNPRVARQVLGMIDNGQTLPRLMMLWVRLYLLENKPERACELFQKLIDRGNPELIQDGLRFAYEVKASDVAWLWETAGRAERAPERAAPSVTPSSPDDVFLVGSTPAILEVKQQIAKFAALEAPVLITGEAGTGKDVIARMLHRQSARRNKPFIPVNCGAIADTLIESELCGHVKGAFTGALNEHEGLFVAAGDGTLFLDEIEALSEHMQATLLRVLEAGEVCPLGSTKPQPVRARVIVASNQPLEKAIAARKFSAGLYERLAAAHIQLPPLRQRTSDIPLLVAHLLPAIYGKSEVVASDELLAAMKAHAWPGNVRELKNAIEMVTLLAGGQTVLTPDLLVLDYKLEPQRASSSSGRNLPVVFPADDTVPPAGRRG